MQTEIEKNVMRRIYRIRILYGIFSLATASLLLLVLSLWGIGREVWVAAVFANGPQNFSGHLLYLLYAFLHTRLIVQFLCLVVLASLFYLAYQTARFLTDFGGFARA